MRVVEIPVAPQLVEPGDVAALSLVGRTPKEQLEHELRPIPGRVEAAHDHGVRAGDRREGVPRHPALERLADQVVHVPGALEVHGAVVVEQLVGPASLLHPDELVRVEQLGDRLAPRLRLAHRGGLLGVREAPEQVRVQTPAGLPAVDSPRGKSGSPSHRAHADVDRVLERQPVAVRRAVDIAVDDQPFFGGIDVARLGHRIRSAAKVSVRDRWAVADELPRTPSRIRGVHALDVAASRECDHSETGC